MASLVGYDSADSENEDSSATKSTKMEKEVRNVGKTTDDLEAEWESFERLISEGVSPGDDGGIKLASGGVSFEQPTFSSSSTRLSFVEAIPETSGNTTFPNMTMEHSSVADQDADSDMDVCSNLSEEKELEFTEQLPSIGQPKAGYVSSLKNTGSSESAENDSESESDRSNSEEPGRKRFSESDDSDDEPDKQPRDSSESDSDDEREVADDVEHMKASTGRRDSASSKSNKGASPKTKSSEKETAGRPSKSDRAHLNPRKDSETRSSSQDRLRNKLMALAEEKVHKSRSRSRSRDRTVAEHSRHSPSSSRRQNRVRDQHRKRRASRSRSRDRRRRSNSRNRHRRRHHSRSRSPKRRHRSRSGSHSRHRYHGRRDSKQQHRVHERRRSRSRSRPKLTFKEQLRAQMLQAQQQKSEEIAQDITVIENKGLITANEKKSALPLNSPNPLVAMVSGTKDKVTPQQALMQTMAAVHAKAQEMTGVAVPSYYNPAAVNPIKYAEQLKKRKLLWSKNKDKEAENEKEVENKAQWTGTSFAADNDGKMAAKFRKLMGIKEEDQLLISDNVDLSKLTEDQRKRQEELFHQLDREYAFARMTTHTHRGIGLGFQSQGLPDV